MKKPTRALLVYPVGSKRVKETAKAIREGVRRTPALSILTEASPETGVDSFELVFLGFENNSKSLNEFIEDNHWKNKSVAFFAVGKGDPKTMSVASKKLSKKGAKILGTLNLSIKGFFSFIGFGSVNEQDLIRARGFGERITNTAFSFKISRNIKKHKIKGYLK